MSITKNGAGDIAPHRHRDRDILAVRIDGLARIGLSVETFPPFSEDIEPTGERIPDCGQHEISFRGAANRRNRQGAAGPPLQIKSASKAPSGAPLCDILLFRATGRNGKGVWDD